MTEFNLTNALKQIKLGCCVRIPALSDDDLRKLKRRASNDSIRPIKIRKIGVNEEGPVYSLLSDESSEDDEVQVVEKTIRTIDLLSDDENSSPMVSSPPTPNVEPSIKIQKISETECNPGENITTEAMKTTATGESIITPSVPTDKVVPKSIPSPNESTRNAIEASTENESVGIATPSETTQTNNVPHLNTPTEQSSTDENHNDYRFIPVLSTNILGAIASPQLDEDVTNTRIPTELRTLGNAVSVIRLNPSNDQESSKSSSENKMNSRVTETLSVQHRENDGRRIEIQLNESIPAAVSVSQSELPNDLSKAIPSIPSIPSIQRMLPKDTRVVVMRRANGLQKTPCDTASSSSELVDDVKVFNKVEITRSVSDRPEKKKYDSSQNADNFSSTQTPSGSLAITALPINVDSSMPSSSPDTCVTEKNRSSDFGISLGNSKPPSSSLPPKIRVKRFAQLANQNAMYNNPVNHLLRDAVVAAETTQNPIITGTAPSASNCLPEDHPILRLMVEDVQPIRKEIDILSLRLKVFFDTRAAQENNIRNCKRKNSNKPEDEVHLICQMYEDSNRRFIEELIPKVEECVMSMEPLDFLSQLYEAFKVRFILKAPKQKQKDPLSVLSELLQTILYSNKYCNMNMRHKLPPGLFAKTIRELAPKKAKNTSASSSQSGCKCTECLMSNRESSVKNSTAVPSTSNLACSRSAVSTSAVFSNTLMDDAQIMPTTTPAASSIPKVMAEQHFASHCAVPISTPTPPNTQYNGWNRNSDPSPRQSPQLAMPPMNVNPQVIPGRSNHIGVANTSVANRVCEIPKLNLHDALAKYTRKRQSAPPGMGNPANSTVRQLLKMPPQPSAFPTEQTHLNNNAVPQIGTPNHGFSNERSTNGLSNPNSRPPPPPYSPGMSSAEEKAAFERRVAEISSENLKAAQLQQSVNRSQASVQRYTSPNSQGMRMVHQNSIPSQRIGTTFGQPLQRMNLGELSLPRYTIRPNHPQHPAHQLHAQGNPMVPRQPNYPTNGFSNDATFLNRPQYNQMINQMNMRPSNVNQMMSRNNASFADLQRNEAIRRSYSDQCVNLRADNHAKFRSSPNIQSMISQQMNHGPVQNNYANQHFRCASHEMTLFNSSVPMTEELQQLTEPRRVIRDSVQEQFIHSTGSPPDGPSPVPTTTFRTQDNTSPSGQIPVIESSSSPNNETNESTPGNTSDQLSKNVENLATEDLMDFENQLSEVI